MEAATESVSHALHDIPALDEALTRLFVSDTAAIADPVPLWTKLREEAPVYRFNDGYLFSRACTIKKLINDRRATHNTHGTGRRAHAARAALPAEGQVAFDEVSAFEAMYMSRNDAEPHDRLRRIAQRTFTPRRIGLIGDIIEQRTTEYLDVVAQKPIADFMGFAYRLPLKIIGDLLGIPDADLEQVHGWSNKLGRNRGGNEYQPLMEAHQALIEFRAYVEGLIVGLRNQPALVENVNLIGDLLDANQGEALSNAELTAMFVVLLFAGHETTTNLIGTGLLSLLQTGQWQRLREQPENVMRAVDELVRYVSPVQWLNRNITETIEIEGHRLEEGDHIYLMIAAANRDPELFDDPETLDIERANSQYHLGFGRGSHICLGSHMAKMEAAATFSALIRRFPDLRLAADHFEWRGHAKLRGLAALPIEFGRERHV